MLCQQGGAYTLQGDVDVYDEPAYYWAARPVVDVYNSPMNYTSAFKMHDTARSRLKLPSDFLVAGDEKVHQLHEGTVSAGHRGVAVGFFERQQLFQFDIFEGVVPNRVGNVISYYKAPAYFWGSSLVIHTMKVYDDAIDAVCEYSFLGNTRFVDVGRRSMLYYTPGPGSSFSVSILRIQRKADTCKLAAFYYCLKKRHNISINNDARSVIRAYVDLNAFEELQATFEFNNTHGIMRVKPVQEFITAAPDPPSLVSSDSDDDGDADYHP